MYRFYVVNLNLAQGEMLKEIVIFKIFKPYI